MAFIRNYAERRFRHLAGWACCGAMALTPLSHPARAEAFVEVFGGRNWTASTDIALRTEARGADGAASSEVETANIEELRPDSKATFGARTGFWITNWGLAVDVSSFNPDLRAGRVSATATTSFDELFGQNVSIAAGRNRQVDLPALPIPTTIAAAGLAMIRLPVGRTVDRPQGRVQPYAFAGPVWLVTNRRLNGKLGLRLGGGVKLPIGRHFGLFGEYRYTSVENAEVKAGTRIGGAVEMRSGGADIVGRMDVHSHSGVVGLSLTL